MTRFSMILAQVLFLSSSAFAADIKINSARLDAEKKNILVEVSHGGGCGEHYYSLKLGGCFETFPVQCSVELVHESDDGCEAYLHKTAVFSLAEYGFTDGYYKGGRLSIWGKQGTVKTSATVVLP